jgi:CRISPR-associated protein Csb1
MELALQEAYDAGKLRLPLVIVDFTPWSPTGDVEADKAAKRLIDAVGKITSLQVPHRLADAILRDSQTPGGVEFRKSEKGRALNTVSLQNATPLYQLCPTALIFGMWDSTGPKGGLGAKFERALVSEVVGVGASIHEIHRARGIRRDPLEIRKTVPILKAADGSWKVVESRTKGAEAPSSINHSSVPFESPNAGTTIEYAEQSTTLSLVVLRRLRFPVNGTMKTETDIAARTVLAALGLCAATLAFENGMGLRSRCLLWPDGPMRWELLDKPGEDPKVFTLTGGEAIGLFNEAVKAAKAAGLTWEEQPITLRPQEKLVDLVRLSQLEATKETGEAGE